MGDRGMSTERRQHGRVRVLRRARIVYGRGWSSLDCVILDLSSAGARIKVVAMLGFPERFELRIDSGSAREAVVRYRAADVTGVEFVDDAAA
jgi:hypothetical protein